MTARPEVIPDIRDHGVEKPSRAAYLAPNPDVWRHLARDHQADLISAYARFGGVWPPYFLEMLRGALVPVDVQREADKQHAAFMRDPRRDVWLGRFPGAGT